MRADQAPLITAGDHAWRALSALDRGEPILLDLGSDSAVVAAAEPLTSRRLDSLRAALGPEAELAVTRRRAETIRARVYDGDVARIHISADRDLAAIRAIADPTQALAAPLLGPFAVARGGDATLARAAVLLCRRARLLPAALIWRAPTDDIAAPLLRVDHGALDALAMRADLGWREVASAQVPLAAAPRARVRLFRRAGGGDEHYVVELGEPSLSEPVLTRLHSACATGDLFGSMKCDCGPQLHAALERMGQEGGVLVYLLQEGRGIGLANKLRAYRLQEDGFDTVEANHRLGFDDDERLLSDGGQILRAIGASRIRLLTNNPAKLEAVTAAGLEVVERLPLEVGRNAVNDAYLRTKAAKSGHLL